MQSFFSHIECSACGATFSTDERLNLCPQCQKPLLARYDTDAAKASFPPEKIDTRRRSLWRYWPMLPVRQADFRLTLGEGFTPLLNVASWGKSVGLESIYVKDESANPTLSFKARGLVMAVSRAAELGVKKIAIPSAGNAAGATAAYCALAGIECHVFMPADVPETFRMECETLGAVVNLVDGLITDCGRRVAELKDREGWFDVSTLKEPYRIEGKKTMGYELAEQFGWTLPDVIVYPTGGGTGLIGMWKAFDEMEELGWIDGKRPRMVSVQTTGCAPIVRAFEQGQDHAEPWQNAATVAAGLRVPAAVGDFLMLRVLRESRGTAVAVADEELLDELARFGAMTGMLVCPEGAAALAATRKLIADGWIQPDERVVVFNTGSGLKYPEAVKMAVARRA